MMFYITGAVTNGNPKYDVIFRCQFHTCAISNNSLKLESSDLDEACRNESKFPQENEVELTFAESQEQSSG